MNRVFKQMGETYGTSPVRVQVWLDGKEVKNSEMIPVALILPEFPDYKPHRNEMFTWTVDADFAGVMKLEILVSGGILLLTDTLATYGLLRDLSSGVYPPPLVPGGPDKFGLIYVEMRDNIIYKDPLTDIVINEISYERERTNELTGQWYWEITDKAKFSCNINIQPGILI